MKGNPKIIAMLNKRLAEEHTAIQQYSTNAAICKNWGYEKLANYLSTRASEEQEHAKELMERILFLDGTVDFAEINQVNVGKTIDEMFVHDRDAELTAIAGYTESIELAVAEKDYGTRKLMEHILEEEDNHLNKIEENMSQIMQMGIENYLPMQIEG